MRTKIALITSFAALGALVPAVAFAQDAAPAAAAPEAAPAPAPAAEPAPAPAPAAEPAAAPAAEEAPKSAAWPGWMRIDSDGGGVQLWAGATAPLTDTMGLAFDLYVAGPYGEFDIGPTIPVSSLTLLPMIGVQMDWSNRTFAALVPQLYLTGSIGPVYEELWLQYYNYKSVYDYTGKVGAANSFFYARAFVDYKISDYVGVGPQLELTNDFEAKEVTSMPVGANVFFFQAGANSTFQAFLGYETKKTFSDNHLAGRLSFVHNF